MPSIMHFEIHADDIERAKTFYMKTFDWMFQKWEEGPEKTPDYYLVTTKKEGEPGINGGLMKREGAAPRGDETIRAFVCTLIVDSIDDYMKKIESNGGKLTTPKMPVMGVGWLCYAEDTEKNLFGIMQNDETAK